MNHNIDSYTIKHYAINENVSLSIAYEDIPYSLPGNGGLRLHYYESQGDQGKEALTLAQHMTQKHRIYNTGFSGVKFVANGTVTADNKKALLNKMGEILNDFDGQLYTGCDLNIDNQDMEYLQTLTPYILNAMDAQHINTSTATAYGVYGSLQSVLDSENADDQSQKILINGLGKVGRIIANKLIADGHAVYTYDIDAKKADIPGAINISDTAHWEKTPCDYLVLCSTSNIIDHSNVNKLACRWIVSSANSPFSSGAVMNQLNQQGIRWIPDVISNAGAVICDSIEHKEPERYKKIKAQDMYQCVYDRVYKKTKQILDISNSYGLTSYDSLDVFLTLSQNEFMLPKAA